LSFRIRNAIDLTVGSQARQYEKVPPVSRKIAVFICLIAATPAVAQQRRPVIIQQQQQTAPQQTYLPPIRTQHYDGGRCYASVQDGNDNYHATANDITAAASMAMNECVGSNDPGPGCQIVDSGCN
jgi:hypothetical protein